MNILHNQKVLTKEEKIKLLTEAYNHCDYWKVEILDASKSWQREPSEMTFEEVLTKFNRDCKFFCTWKKDIKGYSYYRLGFYTKTRPIYFLWVYLGHEEGTWVFSKVGLKGV